MMEQWTSTLAAAGAQFDDTGAADFGDPREELHAAWRADVVCDLSHLGLLRVSGTDAATFLQAQFTNDAGAVNAGRSQLSAYLSPKGRILSVFRLLVADEGYLLCMPKAVLEPTLQRLRLYVLRAHVTLEQVDTRLATIGVSGPRAAALVRAALGDAPTTIDEVCQAGGCIAVCLPGPERRIQLIGAVSDTIRAWRHLTREARPAGYPCWRWLDIAAGLPTVLPATVDSLIPQSVNLDLIGGVSFTKGCYPGQEVVARLHYRGGLKSRMILASVAAAQCPQAGDPVYAPSYGSQRAGQIVDAAAAPDGDWAVLAVVPLADMASGELRLGAGDGPTLRPRPLPYEVSATVAALR